MPSTDPASEAPSAAGTAPEPAADPTAETTTQLATGPSTSPLGDPAVELAAEAGVAAAAGESSPPQTDHAPAAPAPAVAAVVPGEAAPEAGQDAAGPAALADLSPAACAAKLAELFPALFGGRARPIKLKIQADIQQRAPGVFTRRALSQFLHRHTTSTAYLKALVQPGERIDLDGAPAGPVADEHRAAAVAELARRKAIVEARWRDARAQAEQAERSQREAEGALRVEQAAARRERAALLRAYQTTTLTRANFCALKGISETELDARLAQARQEAAERPVERLADARPTALAHAPESAPAGRAGDESRPRRRGGRPGPGRAR